MTDQIGHLTSEDWPDETAEEAALEAAKTKTERWIIIDRWEDFQHPDVGRSTVPPWIKNYTRLLTDDTYLNLTFAERGILHGIWMLYPTHRRVLSESRTKAALCVSKGDTRYFRTHLESLNHAGLIRLTASKPASVDASTAASTRSRSRLERPSSRTSTTGATPTAAPAKPTRTWPWNCSAPRVDERCDRGYDTADEYRRHLWIVHDLDLRKGELDPYLDVEKARAELAEMIARAGG